MKRLSIIIAFLTIGLSVAAQNFTPLLNNTGGNYMGVSLSLGETLEHYNLRPLITKKSEKKELVLIIGASTHGQIAAAMQIIGDQQFDNVKFLNVCAGGHDINKWLDLNSKGWQNLKTKVTAEGYKLSDIQCIIFGTDDLRDGSVLFPQAPQNLAEKIKQFIVLAKTQFPNLKQCDLMSRLCEYEIGWLYPKFKTPTGYFTGFADKFAVENTFNTNHLIKGVWITDATAYCWTNGEVPMIGNINGIGTAEFQFFFSWMKSGNVHMDTRKQGDELTADFILDNYRRYSFAN